MTGLFDVYAALPHAALRAGQGNPDGAVVELASPLHLRDYLHELNDHGLDYKAAGVDSFDQPFLAYLSGPYGEPAEVLVGDPWEGEVGYSTGTRCEECSAANAHTLAHLAYPVRVLTRTVTTPTTARRWIDTERTENP